MASVSCTAAVQPPRAVSGCTGPVSCAGEQMLAADQDLREAVQKRGVTSALADALLPGGTVLEEGLGLLAGDQIPAAFVKADPFSSTIAGGDVSASADLGYSFGWTVRGDQPGHYAAVWKRRNGNWTLAVFLHKRAAAQPSAPPPFRPLRGDRESSAAAARDVKSVDAEFAALARQTGSTQMAFTRYAAADAVQLASRMVFGRDAIHDLLADVPVIEWEPLAGEAAGDLGYTVGAYRIGSARGNYLTVWRLEPDGSWRFVLDGGVSG